MITLYFDDNISFRSNPNIKTVSYLYKKYKKRFFCYKIQIKIAADDSFSDKTLSYQFLQQLVIHSIQHPDWLPYQLGIMLH